MANKETKEFVKLPSKIIDSTYQSLEDGNFQPLSDFTNYLDDFMAIQPAVEGFKEIKNENVSMTIPECDEVENTIYEEMPNLPENDRYDLTKGMAGILGLFRFGWRKGYERALEDVRQGAVQV